MKFQLTFLVLTIFSFAMLNAQEIESPRFGDGLFNLKGKDSTWSMKIGARLQILGMAQWERQNSEFENGESSFLIRRARLKFDGFAYSPKLTYKIQLGLSNNDLSGATEYTSNAPRYILDAVVMWNFYENFELWFGQAKLPGNRELIMSSGNLQFVDRSLLNSTYNIDRDLGVQLKHHFTLSDQFLIREAFAISQGEGRNITKGNLGGLQYTSRLELLPFGDFIKKGDYVGGDIYREPTPKLALGVAYDYNHNAVKTRSNQGAYMKTDSGLYETDISTVFIDAIFKFQGFSFMAEYAKRTADDPVAKNSDGTLTEDEVEVGTGLNLQTGYVFNSNWEISGRYTTINLDGIINKNDLQKQFTLGVSKYIVGHQLKVQSDVSYLDERDANGYLTWRLQFDIHF